MNGQDCTYCNIKAKFLLVFLEMSLGRHIAWLKIHWLLVILLMVEWDRLRWNHLFWSSSGWWWQSVREWKFRIVLEISAVLSASCLALLVILRPTNCPPTLQELDRQNVEEPPACAWISNVTRTWLKAQRCEKDSIMTRLIGLTPCGWPNQIWKLWPCLLELRWGWKGFEVQTVVVNVVPPMRTYLQYS